MSFREEKYVRCVHPYYLPHGSRDLATTIEQGDDQAGCSALGAAPGGASASPGPQAVLPRLALWLAALLLAVRLLAGLLLAARLLAALRLAAWLLAALRLAAWLLAARPLWSSLLLAAQLPASMPLVGLRPPRPFAAPLRLVLFRTVYCPRRDIAATYALACRGFAMFVAKLC